MAAGPVAGQSIPLPEAQAASGKTSKPFLCISVTLLPLPLHRQFERDG